MGQGSSVEVGADTSSQIFSWEDRPASDVDQSAESVSASSLPDSDSSGDTAKSQEEEEQDAVDASSVPPDPSHAHLISSSLSHQRNEELDLLDRRSKKSVSKHRHKAPLTLDELTGHYLAFCPEIADAWHDERHQPQERKQQRPTVDILPATSEHGVVASFCLGPLEGTMLISLSEEALDIFVDEMTPAASLPQDESNSESSSTSCYTQDDENGARLDCEPQHDSTKKRKRAESQSTTTTSNPVSKRRKQKSKSQKKKEKRNRIYFRWAGHLTNTNEFEGDDDIHEVENAGYLHFNRKRKAAHGVWVSDRMFGGRKLRLSLYKIREEAKD
ncbi:hypothetical protein BJY01DRAFT_219872 [Aspergillus pseudoustus]|uniref:Uncharacterized protein n=1 Tax=Aspergillus pseudoustus TaxID=1810923 RepID=A0ABR4JF02_9EURO